MKFEIKRNTNARTPVAFIRGGVLYMGCAIGSSDANDLQTVAQALGGQFKTSAVKVLDTAGQQQYLSGAVTLFIAQAGGQQQGKGGVFQCGTTPAGRLTRARAGGFASRKSIRRPSFRWNAPPR